jgi:hypothetical protein
MKTCLQLLIAKFVFELALILVSTHKTSGFAYNQQLARQSAAAPAAAVAPLTSRPLTLLRSSASYLDQLSGQRVNLECTKR